MGQTFASGHVLGLFDVTTDFRPGVHEWGLWDAQIQDVLDWTVE